MYFETPVAPGREYIVTGNLAGAVYTSFTMESGAAEGAYSTKTSGVLRDDYMDIDSGGNYEIRLGGPAAERNWLAIPDDGGRITTRHYFEWPHSASASQTLHVPISIRVVDPPPPPGRWDDARVAAALQRVINHVYDKTVGAAAASRRTAGAVRLDRAERVPRAVSCPATWPSPRSTPRTRWRPT